MKSKSKRKNLLAVAKHLQSLASQAFDEENPVRSFAGALLAMPIDPKALSAAAQAIATSSTDAAAHDLVNFCRQHKQLVGESLREAHSPVAEMIHVLMDLDTVLPAGSDSLTASRTAVKATTSPAPSSSGGSRLRASPAKELIPSQSSSDLSSSSH
jgi:hypothetical protein